MSDVVKDIHYESDAPAHVHVLIQTDQDEFSEDVMEGVFAVLIAGDENRIKAELTGTTNSMIALGILKGMDEIRTRILEHHPEAGILYLAERSSREKDETLQDLLGRISEQMDLLLNGGDPGEQ